MAKQLYTQGEEKIRIAHKLFNTKKNLTKRRRKTLQGRNPLSS
jgi:hypothetical protein